MMKKIVSLLACLVPATAMGVSYDPGTGNAVGADGLLVGLDTTADSVIVESGNGIVVQSGGITVSDNMYVGVDNQGATTGQMYIETGTDIPFTILSGGDIDITNTLNVAAGRDISFGPNGSAVIDVNIGSISSLGKLTISDVSGVTVGATTVADDFTVSAAQGASFGATTVNGGNTTITTALDIDIAQLVNNGGGTVTLDTGTVNSGTIQNNSGTIDITADYLSTSAGDIENSGTLMQIAVDTDILVDGTMKNDSTAGTMTINAGSLMVNGGDAINPSFVNAGNLNLTVTGLTHLEYGFDLSAMAITNTFSLDTGTLTFGAGMDPDAWLQLLANRLNSFELIVRNGAIVAPVDLINGDGNANANMDLTATSVTVDDVTNNAKILNVNATDTAGGIYVGGDLNAIAGSTTNLISAGELDVTGATVNAGTMVLNGDTVDLGSVANSGDMQILATTGVTGGVHVDSNVVNNGTLFVQGREIDIAGAVINNSGTMTLRGSDASSSAAQIGSLDVVGGVVNIDALVGLNVDGAVTVDGGALNFSASTRNVTAANSINIDGNLTASATDATNAGDVNVAAIGTPNFTMTSTAGAIDIGGDVSAIENDQARAIILNAAVTEIAGNVTAGGMGILRFVGDFLGVTGDMLSDAGGTIDLGSGDTQVGTLAGAGTFVARGNIIEATAAADDAINIQNGIWYDGTEPASGFIIKDTTDLTLWASGADADIRVAGGITIGVGNKLTLSSADELNVSGLVTNDGELYADAINALVFTHMITNSGTMDISNFDMIGITTADIVNTGTMNIDSGGAIVAGDITNSGNMTIGGTPFDVGTITSTAGTLDIDATTLNATAIAITGGVTTLDSGFVTATNDINVSGDMVQGGNSGMLNLTRAHTSVEATNLIIGGDFNAFGESGGYDVQNSINITGTLNVAGPATVLMVAPNVSFGGLDNGGMLGLEGDDIDLGDATNSGTMMIFYDTLAANNFVTTAGGVYLSGNSIDVTNSINLAGQLLQNSFDTPTAGDVNLISNDFVMNAASVTANGISQTSGALRINTNDLNIVGNIGAGDLMVSNLGANWLDVSVGGDIAGGIYFYGLEKMTVGGDYTFNDSSRVLASVLDRASSGYWATVNGNGQFSGATEALISINGKLINDLSSGNPSTYPAWDKSTVGPLLDSQFGVNIFDIIDPGTAIWLLHADGGIADVSIQSSNAVVRFCNASGTICYNYFDTINDTGSADPDDLPAYLAMRDTDGDGVADSLYLVFDPAFGGPLMLPKIQPIVAAEPSHTGGEYDTAGALDEMIAAQLAATGFPSNAPLVTLQGIFDNTIFSDFGDELYARMVQFDLGRDGAPLSRFSRLFQPHEIDQIVNTVSQNEHTTFRDFEDRMLDEFIWNRNRSLKKLWVDADFGMFQTKTDDGLRADGDRFSVIGGFDWQSSPTLILGLSAHASYSDSTATDTVDIGYTGTPIWARAGTDVTDLNIGVGGYMMKTLNQKMRLYGNAFLDIHQLEVSRDQEFIDGQIQGSGSSFSIASEWGLLHDWLNQYIVGNLYARVGYNSGFSITENVGNTEYARMEQEGYIMLTPGYSLTAQKRVYPSAWFQFRPNITIGAEYDVLGVPDVAQFKFGPAQNMTDYNVSIDPLWMYAGAGIEFLTASGFQFGIDYRYQYNADVQMHKFKLSGIYRF